MENESSHQDDEIVLQAQEYLKGRGLRQTDESEIIRGLLNRIMDKKVEIRGLESQVHSLQQDRIGLEMQVAGLEKKIKKLDAKCRRVAGG